MQVLVERRSSIQFGAVLITISLLLAGGCSGDGMDWHAKNISGLMPELQFQLVAETGKKVQADDYKGKVKMLFFGFTHCPHFCPTTLSKLGQALNSLPEDLRQDVQILFVSIDPHRDTLENIGVYTDNFVPQVIGLTGQEDDLRDLAKRYRTTFSYGEPDEQGSYDVSHGRAVYVFDRQGDARLMILEEQPVEQIAGDLRQLIETTG